MNIRKCVHGVDVHGILYVCPDYPLELRREIIEQGIRFKELCASGDMPVEHRDKNGNVTFKCTIKDIPPLIGAIYGYDPREE